LPANAIDLPSRIAFKTASKVDSRTIPDAGGAEALLGRSDILFQPPRVSGFFRQIGEHGLVSDEEINRIGEDAEYPMDIHALVENGEDADTELGNENWEDDIDPPAARNHTQQ
jgi:S-DNA-T family DNA segregation ATPase FtsK/SpoIIIE